jgi:hypothetical protein
VNEITPPKSDLQKTMVLLWRIRLSLVLNSTTVAITIRQVTYDSPPPIRLTVTLQGLLRDFAAQRNRVLDDNNLSWDRAIKRRVASCGNMVANQMCR